MEKMGRRHIRLPVGLHTAYASQKHTVPAHDFLFLAVPANELSEAQGGILVESVHIACLTGSTTAAAESNLPQSAYFPHHGGSLVSIYRIQLHIAPAQRLQTSLALKLFLQHPRIYGRDNVHYMRYHVPNIKNISAQNK